jgi:hypothetical protein
MFVNQNVNQNVNNVSGESAENPGSAGVKRGVGAGGDAKENASPAKKKRPKTTDIVLPNAPKEGEKTICGSTRLHLV